MYFSALALLDAVERRLRDEDAAAINQLVHVAEEEGQQQRADVRAVHVGIGHDDDLAVAELGRVEIVFADAGAQRRDHGADFLVAQHLVVARLLHVQDLALQRQDGLETAVAALFGGAAGRFALHQEQLATLGILLLAIGQFAGQTARIERAFAPRQVARLAGRLARARRVDGLAHDLPHHRRILVEILAQLVVDELGHVSGDIAVQLSLGLALELRLRDLHAHHRRQAFAHIVAAEVLLHVLEQSGRLPGRVNGAGERGAKASQVRAAIHRVDVVGEAEKAFRIAVVILQRDFHRQSSRVVRQFPVGFEVDGLVVQHRLAAVQMLDELRDAAAVQELVALHRVHALIGQVDFQAFVQERQLAQPLRQRVVIIGGLHHDRGIRP